MKNVDNTFHSNLYSLKNKTMSKEQDTEDDTDEVFQRLKETLGSEKGYFGRVYTYGQRPTKFEYIGYMLEDDFLEILKNMDKDQQTNLKDILNYFEAHSAQLKKILLNTQDDIVDEFFSEIAWSHFMMVIMFGMLEIAVKGKRGIGLNEKGKKITNFLEKNLTEEYKKNITKRYIGSDEKTFNKFCDVIDDLWSKIRSGFIHDGLTINKIPLEWTITKGEGTKNNPITFQQVVPMQELLQMTWQSVLHSYGYKGELKLPNF